MSDRILILFQYRSASHLFLKLLLGRPGVENYDRGLVYKPGQVVWSPKTSVQIFHGGPDTLAESKSEISYTYLGDWWGQVSSLEDIPLVNEAVAPTRWWIPELSRFNSGWKIFSLVRDPRGVIASTMERKTERAHPLRRSDPEAYLRLLCRAARNRLRVVLDCEREFSNYHILRAEDLISSPVQVLQAFSSFAGLPFDPSPVENCLRAEEESKASDIHSSFTSAKGFSHRWWSWDDWKQEVAWQELSAELSDLEKIPSLIC